MLLLILSFPVVLLDYLSFWETKLCHPYGAFFSESRAFSAPENSALRVRIRSSLLYFPRHSPQRYGPVHGPHLCSSQGLGASDQDPICRDIQSSLFTPLSSNSTSQYAINFHQRRSLLLPQKSSGTMDSSGNWTSYTILSVSHDGILCAFPQSVVPMRQTWPRIFGTIFDEFMALSVILWQLKL